MAQAAVSLVVMAHGCPGSVGLHVKALLEDGALKQGTAKAWKDLLPLPVEESVLGTVQRIVQEGEFRLKKSGMSGGAIKAAYRAVGIDCFVFLLICGLNVMWGGLRRKTRVPFGPIRPAQQAAIDRLREAATYMVDGTDGAEKGGVPRTPSEGWEGKVKDGRLSYHGEIVAKAEPIELVRVLASLPPVGFGASVKLMDLCEGEIRDKLADPLGCLLPWGACSPRPTSP